MCGGVRAGRQLQSAAGSKWSDVGGPDSIISQIKECRQVVGAGVLDLSLTSPGSSDLRALMDSLELFGTKVLPHIRDI